ncbi:hypothetical protein BH09PSE1_BH09PSE1_23390 [soil metagenome]
MAARLAGRRNIDGKDYGIVSGTGADMAPRINAAMADIAARGGGVLQLPPGVISISSPIDNKYARVEVIGANADSFHDAGNLQPGTRVVPTGSFAGVALLRHRTPYAAEQGIAANQISKNTGGGFRFIETFGGPRGLLVDTISLASYDLSIISASVYGAEFTSGRSGTDIGEAADTQGNRIQLRVRQIDPGYDSVDCVFFNSTATPNANTSLNKEIQIFVQHKNGHGLKVRSGDNNIITIAGVRAAGGTGKLVQIGDAANYDANIGGNVFTHLSGNGGAHLLGTDTAGAIANTALILELDNGNGTPLPTMGTGSIWQVMGTTTGVMLGQSVAGLALGESLSNAQAAKAAMTVETVHIRNGSSSHVIMSDPASNSWAQRIDGGNGNLEFLRLAGTGALNLPNVAGLKLGGSQVSVGAADSGGAGFRYLRIPN